jgi:hypothetical protein
LILLDAGRRRRPKAAEDVLRVLAWIARTGKPGDRLRAAELIGKQLGLFRDDSHSDAPMSFAEMVLAAQRKREVPAANEVIDLYAERPKEVNDGRTRSTNSIDT